MLIPLKTENQRFFDVFRGIEKEHGEEKGYISILDEALCRQMYVMILRDFIPFVQFKKRKILMVECYF